MKKPALWLIFLAAGLAATASPAAARSRGAPISEVGLFGRRDILFFCDFEGRNWTKYFSPGTRRRYAEDDILWRGNDKKNVFAGLQSARSFHKKGAHGAGGVTYYLDKGYTQINQRVYLYFPEDFVIKPANGIKLIWFWAYQPGREYTGSGAGTRPNGTDKFSCHIVVERNWTLAFYCYHLDQRGGYGDTVRLSLNGGSRIKPGTWNCIELGVKVNDVGQKNGELKGWLNGQLKGHMKNLRLRAVEPLQIRRTSVTMYFGGAGAVNSSPKDQYAYYDNYVVAEKYIGRAVFKRPEAKKKKPRRVVYKPKEKADPLKEFKEQLDPVRKKVKEADFAGALTACDKVLAGSEGKAGAAALKTYRAGLAAGAELKKLIIAEAATKKPRVYIDFAGRPMRAKIVSASETSASFEMSGTAMPLKWRQVSPNRFYGIGAKFVPDTPEGHLTLARYCAAAGLAEQARKEIEKAATKAGLHGEIEKLKALLK